MTSEKIISNVAYDKIFRCSLQERVRSLSLERVGISCCFSKLLINIKKKW